MSGEATGNLYFPISNVARHYRGACLLPRVPEQNLSIDRRIPARDLRCELSAEWNILGHSASRVSAKVDSTRMFLMPVAASEPISNNLG